MLRIFLIQGVIMFKSKGLRKNSKSFSQLFYYVVKKKASVLRRWLVINSIGLKQTARFTGGSDLLQKQHLCPLLYAIFKGVYQCPVAASGAAALNSKLTSF